jgi:hypothetical protein
MLREREQAIDRIAYRKASPRYNTGDDELAAVVLVVAAAVDVGALLLLPAFDLIATSITKYRSDIRIKRRIDA